MTALHQPLFVLADRRQLGRRAHLLCIGRVAGDQLHPGFGEALGAHVAASDGPLVVLLRKYCSDKADAGGPFGKIPTTSVFS